MSSSPTERWASKSYRSIRDYSLMRSPAWLQERAQGLFRDAMIRRIAVHSGENAPFARGLDLGCGVGDWTIRYLSIAQRMVGVDVNPSFLAEARARLVDEPRGADVRFANAAIQSWDDFERVSFVALGACLMYLDDDETESLLARIAAALPPQGLLYVRASVVTAWRAPYRTDAGFYRSRDWYESQFVKQGFHIVEAATSAQITAASLPGNGAVTQWVQRLIAGAARAERTVRRQNDFMNWVLLPGR